MTLLSSLPFGTVLIGDIHSGVHKGFHLKGSKVVPNDTSLTIYLLTSAE